MCSGTILKNRGRLESAHDCYKNQQMCDKVVNNYLHVLKCVPSCYKTAKLCDKAVNTYPSTTQFVTAHYETQEMCNPAVNPVEDGLFWGCSRIGGEGRGKKASLPKICHTYPTMMKLGTVIPYPKKILKIYESRDTPISFC